MEHRRWAGTVIKRAAHTTTRRGQTDRQSGRRVTGTDHDILGRDRRVMRAGRLRVRPRRGRRARMTRCGRLFESSRPVRRHRRVISHIQSSSSDPYACFDWRRPRCERDATGVSAVGSRGRVGRDLAVTHHVTVRYP